MSQTFDSDIDYYKVLGLNEKATSDELKQAHIELALKYHPDTATKAADQGDRADKFIAVTEAWKVLSNSAVRANYDAVRLRQTSHTVGTFTRSSFVGASRFVWLGLGLLLGLLLVLVCYCSNSISIIITISAVVVVVYISYTYTFSPLLSSPLLYSPSMSLSI